MRVVVVANRSAGAFLVGGTSAEEITAALGAAGVEARVELVEGDAIGDTVRAAVAAGVDAIVAAGGDGTIRSVAAALSGGSVPLGVLPLGTLNHFARDLGIPVEIAGAARVIATGEVRCLDLAEVNGEVFVNNSVLGFYPPVVYERDRQRRLHGTNKWRAAFSAMLRLWPRLPALNVRVEVEGTVLHRSTRFVFVGNNEYSMNAFTFGARSRFDSGDLYLYIADCPGRLCLLGLAALSLFKDLTQDRHFDSWRVPELAIELANHRVTVCLDGELVRLETPLLYRTRERALPVLVPAPTEEAPATAAPDEPAQGTTRGAP